MNHNKVRLEQTALLYTARAQGQPIRVRFNDFQKSCVLSATVNIETYLILRNIKDKRPKKLKHIYRFLLDFYFNL
jgi:hypothetical protein